MTGLVWILAALNVFLRDIYYLVTVSLFLLLILSPIAYTMDMVPAKLRFWLTFNPVYYFVAAFQEILLFGRLPSKAILLPMMIVSLLFFQLGFILFRRLKPAFADYL
jgi:lipopolysaccharide transport system permease protein